MVYGTTINLSHLIHELGHAVAAEMDEYIQYEDGSYAQNVGASTCINQIDKESHIVKCGKPKGLYLEEALNSLEEERILGETLGISSIKKIPGYVNSRYQGMMTEAMSRYISVFGYEPFNEFRIMKNNNKLSQIQGIIEKTFAYKEVGTEEYVQRKRQVVKTAENLEGVSEMGRERINEFFEEYDNIYFSTKLSNSFMERLDNSFEQMYNFQSIRGKFNIASINFETGEVVHNENNRKIYSNIVHVIMQEAYKPLEQVEQERKQYRVNEARDDSDDTER